MNTRSTTPRDEEITQSIDRILDPFARTDAPGLVIGIAHAGRVLYRRGVGMASLDQPVANTPATRMNLGSTAKHMTSLAVMLLAEEAKLDIDAPVRRYLPALPPQPQEPTLRQLMSHTSGYRCYLDLSMLGDALSAKPKGYALASQLRQSDTNFPPGQKMLYCNGGYHLLSIIVERVSGMPFREFLARRIFEPIGMYDTTAIESDLELHRGAATPHVPGLDGKGWRRGVFPHAEVRGDGAVLSTIDDMLDWIAHLRGLHRVGTDDTWREMTAHTVLTGGLETSYGLGLVRAPYRGVEAIHHSGGLIGGSCQMLTIPSHALDIIVMVNGAAVDPSALAYQVVDIVLGDDVLGPRPQATRALASDYPGLAGRRYGAPSGMVIGFLEADGELRFSMLGNYPMPMQAHADSLELAYEDVGVGPFSIGVTPADLRRGVPEALEISECGHSERFELLPIDPPSLREEGEELVGRYYSGDMDARAHIYFEGEVLHLQVNDGFGVSLAAVTPLDRDVFLWKMAPPMLPVPGILHVEREGASISGFRLDAARTRRVAFLREDRA